MIERQTNSIETQKIMKTKLSKQVLVNLAKQVEAHNEIISGMKAVSLRLHYSGVRIGEKLGAVAYGGSVSSGWMRFLMPDGKVIFGTISSVSEKSDIIANVSDINVFKGIADEIGFQYAENGWKKYFNIPEFETEENFKQYTLI